MRAHARPASGRLLLPRTLQPRYRRTKVCLRRVPEFLDEGILLQDSLHDPSLHSLSSSVNQSNLTQPALVGGADVLIDDRGNVAGMEGVEIDLRFDWDAVQALLVFRFRSPFSLLP